MAAQHSGEQLPTGTAALREEANPPAPTPPQPRTSRWEEIPLSTRLVATFVVVLTCGLMVAFIVTSTLLRSSLLAQLDHHLASTAESLTGGPTEWMQQLDASDESLPNQFYIRLDMDNGESVIQVHDETVREFGKPLIETPNIGDTATFRQAFTVPNATQGGSWRVYQVQMVSATNMGVASVALPTASVLRPLEDSIGLLVTTSMVLVVVGVLVSWLAIRRALSPLREIEATAGAIAAGDLSRRIRAHPLNTEVGSLAHSLNTMLAQIEQAFADRTASEARTRQFISDASHELRTPVATIRGYAELYRMGGIPQDDISTAMRRIEDEAARMGNLVADLLQLARLDEGRRLIRQLINIREVAEDAASDLRVLDRERCVQVIDLHEDDGDEILAWADPDKIHQLLANLVGNIIQHTPPGSPVEFAVGYHDGYAAVEVRDHGPGVEAAQAAQIFRRFYRVDTSRSRSSGGSGLGLAIVAAIVEAHAGQLAVRTTAGGGFTIRILLPASQAQAHSEQKNHLD
ncbi:MAG: HAMP domain-containing sensor histidine kinase [Bowdeniella nasicola]|nr:HAMP domain-containing sensor histidine kinase [Bowdeniella nasicola]